MTGGQKEPTHVRVSSAAPPQKKIYTSKKEKGTHIRGQAQHVKVTQQNSKLAHHFIAAFL